MLKPWRNPTVALRLDRIYNQDCIAGMKKLDDGSVDLAFADPPFNIGYDYDVYKDKLEGEHYLDWSRRCHSFFLPGKVLWHYYRVH